MHRASHIMDPLSLFPSGIYHAVDANAARAAPALDCWGDIDGVGRIILNGRGLLVACDRIGRSLIDRKKGLTLRHEMMCTVNARHQHAFDTCRAASSASPSSLLLPLARGESLLLGFCSFDAGALSAISVRLIDDQFQPQFACLDQAFGLTPAELTIATELLYGKSPSEIADSCGLSINTVRCHVAHVYAKLNIGNREALWRRCAPYRTR